MSSAYRWLAAMAIIALVTLVTWSAIPQTPAPRQVPPPGQAGRAGAKKAPKTVESPKKKKGDKKAGPPRADGLPPGHPPVGPPPSRGKPRLRPKPGQGARNLLNPLRPKGPPKSDPAPKKPGFKYPRDEHGYCKGRGIDDRPADVNLMHGWLGARVFWGTEDDPIEDHELVQKRDQIPWYGAVPRPRVDPPDPNVSTWSMENFDRVWPYWKWRLTPYPYRYDNKNDECHPRNQPVPLLANIVNLGALLFLFVRFGRKPVRTALKNRRDTIMKEIDDARKMRKSARKRLKQYEDDLDHLDDKLQELTDQYAAEGVLAEAHVVEEAGDARDRMMTDAEFRVSQESKQTRDDLSREALEQAIDAAETLLTQAVTPADHDRLAEEFLGQIEDALKDDRGGNA